MNRYRQSNGEYITKARIDAKVKAAKKEKAQLMYEEKPPRYCEAFGRCVWNQPIDKSHIISVKDCQEMGKSELAWDVNNIQDESREAHHQWEHKELYWEHVKKHKNFDYKMEYIRKHDTGQYNRLMLLDEMV